MSSEETKQEIINKLYNHNISERELAASVGLSPQALHYCLHNSATLDLTVYNNIESFFKKRGIMVNPTEEKLSNISMITLEFNSLTSQIIDILGNLMKSTNGGQKMQIAEKEMKIQLINNFEADLHDKFELIKGMVKNG